MTDDEATGMDPDDAREWLGEWLNDESDWDPDDPERVAWFKELTRFVRALPDNDPRLEESARYLEPLFEWEQLAETTMYDGGRDYKVDTTPLIHYPSP